MKRSPQRHRAALAAAVLALHAALLLVPGTPPAPRRPASAARVAVRLLPAQPAAPRPIAAAPAPREHPREAARPRTAAVGPPTRKPAPITLVAPPAAMGATPRETPQDEPALTPMATAPPASVPRPPALLDSDATRRALHEAARSQGPGGRTVAEADGAVARPQERLGQGIARGAHGDCLQGEYTGAGMGLLSLPFLAAAALSDRCRH